MQVEFDFELSNIFTEQGRVQAVLCCALSVPPRAVSSIQVAPSDISGVFWEWTKLVLDIGNFLANATIWLLTRKGWAEHFKNFI